MASRKKSIKQDKTAPLFIDLEGDKVGKKVQTFVMQVINELFPKLENPRAMTAEVATEIQRLKIKTLSSHLVSGFIKNRIAEQKPGVSKEGYLLPQFSDNALTVLRHRYLKKGKNREPIEQPYQMYLRVAQTIAKADQEHGKSNKEVEEISKSFYEIMVKRLFVPNSPTLMNAGRTLGQLSACFVLPVEDSMESIFEAVKQTALIHKSGGGTGFSFSRLRPAKDPVRTTKGISSGPISFIAVFDAATETIKQGGARRGANMAILQVDHPDILDFITCKADLSKLNNFNISVGITDKFIKAVEKGEKYDLINPRTKEKAGSLSARKVFDMIVAMAWANGEPGMVFIDRINAANPTPVVGKIEATNPCGEQPLLPHESCNLGSLNLALMVENDKINWDLLKESIDLAVHFLDNVIDINDYPLPEIREMTMGNRKIGLGVMGWADMLVQMNIPYNSAKALKLAEQVMSFILDMARKASCRLAVERGEFPNIDKSVYAKNPKGKRPRNATVTTIAPTGTISIIAGASSGIEPVFAISFYRRVLDGQKLIETNPYFELIAKKEGFYSEKLMEKIALSGTIQDIDEIPDHVKRVFVTSHDISPQWHVKMQAAFQKYTENAVSKTVNFPEDATASQVAKVFNLAYASGCKGITVYRYNSRESVLNVQGKSSTPKGASYLSEQVPVYNAIEPRPRSKGRITGSTELSPIGCGKLYVTVNTDEVGVCEVFTTLGRSGGCPSQSEATGRLASLALRSGVKLDAIIEQLKGIRCHSAIRQNDSSKLKKNNGERSVSCPAAIAAALEGISTSSIHQKKTELENEKNYTPPAAAGTPKEHEYLDKDLCPDCGASIQHAGGCVVCHSCGYSKCG